MSGLMGASLAGANPTRGRVENDFYATEPATTKLFLDEFIKTETITGDILEPACGQGHISEVLKQYFVDNNIYSSDLVDRGYGIPNIDFLNYDFQRKFNTIITNPPFKYAKEFIIRGLELSEKYVVMFAKIQLLEGKDRKKMFEQTPLKYVYVHSSRQNPMRNGKDRDENGKKWSSTMAFAWYVWDKEYTGEPIIKWI